MDASRCLVTVKFVDLSIPRVCNGGRQMEDWRSGTHSDVRMTGQRWLSLLSPLLILILRTRLGPGLTSRQFPAQSTLRVKFSLKETESEPRRARATQSRATLATAWRSRTGSGSAQDKKVIVLSSELCLCRSVLCRRGSRWCRGLQDF